MNGVPYLKTGHRNKNQGNIGQEKKTDGGHNKLDGLADDSAFVFSTSIDVNNQDNGINGESQQDENRQGCKVKRHLRHRSSNQPS